MCNTRSADREQQTNRYKKWLVKNSTKPLENLHPADVQQLLLIESSQFLQKHNCVVSVKQIVSQYKNMLQCIQQVINT